MSDNILDRYSKRREDASATGSEHSVEDDHGCFGYLRGIRDRSAMLQFRHKDGRIAAFPYGSLIAVYFNPSVGIMVHLGRVRITIIGRNLNQELRPNVRLFDGIAKHRVPWIKEDDSATGFSATEEAIVIESFVFEE